MKLSQFSLNEFVNDLKKRRPDSLAAQLIRYAFVGGIAATVDVGTFSFFAIYLSLDYRIAILLGFTLGTLTNFAISNAFVFDRKSLPVWVACIRHYVSSLGGLATNEVVMIALIELAQFEHLFLAKLIATGCAFVTNFILIKYFAFNEKIRLFKSKEKSS